jgi:hypothetical protein
MIEDGCATPQDGNNRKRCKGLSHTEQVPFDSLIATGIKAFTNKQHLEHDLLWKGTLLKHFEMLANRGNILQMTADVAAMCDHAQTEDGVGFSKNDYKTGHLMVKMIPFADAQRLRAWTRQLYKYRGQLGLTDDGFYHCVFGLEDDGFR